MPVQDVTEFTWLDPTELHLVGMGANGFAPLLAKAAAEVDYILEKTTPGITSATGIAGVDMDDDDDALKSTECEDGFAVKFVSAEARRKMAASGSAMPDGSFPIADEGHLRSAIGRLGNYKGDKAAAKRHIIKRARALGLTHMLPSDWSTSKAQTDMPDPTPMASPGIEHDPSQEEGNPPHVAAAGERPAQGEGHGDTAPDKAEPMGEALSQTNAQKAEGDGRGDVLPDKKMSPDESEGQTEKASEAWEQKDIELANKAVKALSEALDIVKEFAAREKAEATQKSLGEINLAISRATDLVSGLSSGAVISQAANKEIEDMTKDEFNALLDERDARKSQEAEEAVKAKAKAGDGDGDDEKDAQPASKSAPEEGFAKAVGEAVSKAVKDEIEPFAKRLADVEELLEKQPAARPMVNATGVQSGAQMPVTREGQEQSGSAFKALEDAVANARTTQERQRLGGELLKAKAIAGERIREQGGSHNGPVSLLAQSRAAAVNAAADAQ